MLKNGSQTLPAIKMFPKKISIADFTYPLPEEKIAKHPKPERDQSKLLVYNKSISHHQFFNIPDLLPSQTLLVLNNTKVIHARLGFRRSSGALIELFCLEPNGQSVEEALMDRQSCRWNCLVGNAKRWKGEVLVREIEYQDKSIRLMAELMKVELSKTRSSVILEKAEK